MDDGEYLIKCLIEKLESNILKAEGDEPMVQKPEKEKKVKVTLADADKGLSAFNERTKKDKKLLETWNKMQKVKGKKYRLYNGKKYTKTQDEVNHPVNKNKKGEPVKIQRILLNLVEEGVKPFKLFVSPKKVISTFDSSGGLITALKKLIADKEVKKYFDTVKGLKDLISGKTKNLRVEIEFKGNENEAIAEYFKNNGEGATLNIFNKISEVLSEARTKAKKPEDIKAIAKIEKVIKLNNTVFVNSKRKSQRSKYAKLIRDKGEEIRSLSALETDKQNKVNVVTMGFFKDLAEKLDSLKGLDKSDEDEDRNLNIITKVLTGIKSSDNRFKDSVDFTFALLTNLDNTPEKFENVFPEFIEETSQLVRGSDKKRKVTPKPKGLSQEEQDKANRALVEAKEREDREDYKRETLRLRREREPDEKERKKRKKLQDWGDELKKADGESILNLIDITYKRRKVNAVLREKPYNSTNEDFSRLEEYISKISSIMKDETILKLFKKYGKTLLSKENKKVSPRKNKSLQSKLDKIKQGLSGERVDKPITLLKEIKELHKELEMDFRDFSNIFNLTSKKTKPTGLKDTGKTFIDLEGKEKPIKVPVGQTTIEGGNVTLDKIKSIIANKGPVDELFKRLKKQVKLSKKEINLERWTEEIQKIQKERDTLDDLMYETKELMSNKEEINKVKTMVKLGKEFEKRKARWKVVNDKLYEANKAYVSTETEYSKEPKRSDKDNLKIMGNIRNQVKEYLTLVNSKPVKSKKAPKEEHKAKVEEWQKKVDAIEKGKFFSQALKLFPSPKNNAETVSKISEIIFSEYRKDPKHLLPQEVEPTDKETVALNLKLKPVIDKLLEEKSKLEEEIILLLQQDGVMERKVKVYTIGYAKKGDDGKPIEDTKYKIVTPDEIKHLAPESKKKLTLTLKLHSTTGIELEKQIGEIITIDELMEQDYSMLADSMVDYKELESKFNKLTKKIDKETGIAIKRAKEIQQTREELQGEEEE